MDLRTSRSPQSSSQLECPPPVNVELVVREEEKRQRPGKGEIDEWERHVRAYSQGD